ncbi:hypothetical protein BO86DRAFT_270676, partial [Aspergillus japonicus CBS 114.51]
LDPEVDMFGELREHLAHMKQQRLSEWEKKEKSRAFVAFRHVANYVVSRSKILVSTNNNMASSFCAQNFGQEAKAIILIRDEDPKELEVNGIIPLTKCGFSDKIKGIVLAGDIAQLKPTVI